MTAIKIEKDH